jgi:hypothetical protein
MSSTQHDILIVLMSSRKHALIFCCPVVYYTACSVVLTYIQYTAYPAFLCPICPTYSIACWTVVLMFSIQLSYFPIVLVSSIEHSRLSWCPIYSISCYPLVLMSSIHIVPLLCSVVLISRSHLALPSCCSNVYYPACPATFSDVLMSSIQHFMLSFCPNIQLTLCLAVLLSQCAVYSFSGCHIALMSGLQHALMSCYPFHNVQYALLCCCPDVKYIACPAVLLS